MCQRAVGQHVLVVFSILGGGKGEAALAIEWPLWTFWAITRERSTYQNSVTGCVKSSHLWQACRIIW